MQPAVVLSRCGLPRFLQGSAALIDNFSPAPSRGFFWATRCATDCGMVSVGLLLLAFRQTPWNDLAPLRRGFFMAGLCNDVFFGLAVTAARSGQSRVITINLKLGSSLISYSCPSLHFTSSTS